MSITVVQNQTPSLMEFREITPSNIPTNPKPTTTTTTTSQPQTSYQEMSTWNTSAPSFIPSWYNNNNNHNNVNYGTPSAPTTAEPVPMTSQGVTQSPFGTKRILIIFSFPHSSQSPNGTLRNSCVEQ